MVMDAQCVKEVSEKSSRVFSLFPPRGGRGGAKSLYRATRRRVSLDYLNSRAIEEIDGEPGRFFSPSDFFGRVVIYFWAGLFFFFFFDRDDVDDEMDDIFVLAR